MPFDIGADAQRFLLIFFRIVAMLWLMPFFSSKAISMPFKAGVSLLIAFLLFQSVPLPAPAQQDPYALLLMVFREILIGAALGFVVKVFFAAVAAAGEMPALQAGFGFARFMDPTTMTQVSVLEEVLNVLALMIFFAVDGHLSLMKSLFTSFKDIPLGNAVFGEPFFMHLLGVSGKIFSLGLMIGAPVIVTLFLAELCLGMLSRMVPQINVFVEGVPLKIIITLTILSLSLNILAPVIGNMFRSLQGEVQRVINLMV